MRRLKPSIKGVRIGKPESTRSSLSFVFEWLCCVADGQYRADVSLKHNVEILLASLICRCLSGMLQSFQPRGEPRHRLRLEPVISVS